MNSTYNSLMENWEKDAISEVSRAVQALQGLPVDSVKLSKLAFQLRRNKAWGEIQESAAWWKIPAYLFLVCRLNVSLALLRCHKWTAPRSLFSI